MDEQNLIGRLIFILKMFARIFLFALIAFMMVSGLDLNPATSYKIIIFSAIIGTIMGIDDTLRRFK